MTNLFFLQESNGIKIDNTVTIWKTYKGYWMKMFNAYQDKAFRISEKEAKETIELRKSQGEVILSTDKFCIYHN